MFYSRQLLARKAPLGQIWLAATLHAKIDKKKLHKLDIIHICEQILNPAVPMGLRLSGILMGGVVIVYGRKVNLLLDDVNRLLVEINTAWKVKDVPDRTLLPKGKSQAKFEAVTLPDNQGTEEVEEIERSRHFSESATVMGFQQTSYVSMHLDNVDTAFTSTDVREDDQAQYYHQVDFDKITLFEGFDYCQADTDLHNRFERFDIEEDVDTQMNFAPDDHTQIPTNIIPSPPRKEEPRKSDELQEKRHDDHVEQPCKEAKKVTQMDEVIQKQEPPRKRARRTIFPVMDYEQTIIPAPIYQSWLQNAPDTVSKRGRKRKSLDSMPTMKIKDLMDIPPVVIACRLFDKGYKQIYYPAPLLEQWLRSTQPPHDSPSGTTAPQPPAASSSSHSERLHHQDLVGFPPDGDHAGVSSQLPESIEKQMKARDNNEMPAEILMDELRNNLKNFGIGATKTSGVSAAKGNMISPSNSGGDEFGSIPSSGSGHAFLIHSTEVNTGWSNKKRSYSLTRNLETVAEETAWQNIDPNYKLASPPGNGLTLDNELVVETGPTQTQKYPAADQPSDQITNAIQEHLKIHFDTPGCPKIVSVDQLVSGMNRKKAACFFHSICVLVTHECIGVQQKVPYGDILISRGAKI
ncbi:sister chromatid cohesion 1 protein 1 [Apium graveolens]|uniref:sister chromatid cohesion 1 protein 1 n=1 Tax=Apium graveolens TaxID=4045 RepID=UPI003D7A222E